MLLQAQHSIVVVIDIQARLQPAIDQGGEVVRHAAMLLDAARVLDVPVLVTEQYPKGLGPTVEEIATRLPNGTPIISKLTFSAARNAEFADAMGTLRATGRSQAVICGTEAHICVMQTTADLLADDMDVFLVIDASSSRTATNREAAHARLARLGAHCVTTEMVLFEWLETAGTDQFKTVSKLVK